MGAPSLDNEFMQYWSKLTVIEKESLLNVAKNYVLLNIYSVFMIRQDPSKKRTM
jgi:hypothetical protein